MYKKLLAILFILCLALPVSAKKRQSETVITPMKQLEKRQFQTRTYPASDKITVMKALLNVYQDEGFIVYNANSLLGFIYGAKDFDLTDSDTDISKEFGLTKSRLNFNGVTVATLETTANVTDYGQTLRVRVNFKRKLLNTYGTAQFVDDINDEEYYEEFFSKLDNAIALQKQISPAVVKKVPPQEEQKPAVQKTEEKVLPKTEDAKASEQPAKEKEIKDAKPQKETANPVTSGDKENLNSNTGSQAPKEEIQNNNKSDKKVKKSKNQDTEEVSETEQETKDSPKEDK